MPNINLLAAIAIAAGARTPYLWGKVLDYVFNHDYPFTFTPADVSGVGAAMVAGGATTPYWLEQVGNIVLTYPYTRSANDVLNVP